MEMENESSSEHKANRDMQKEDEETEDEEANKLDENSTNISENNINDVKSTDEKISNKDLNDNNEININKNEEIINKHDEDLNDKDYLNKSNSEHSDPKNDETSVKSEVQSENKQDENENAREKVDEIKDNISIENTEQIQTEITDKTKDTHLDNQEKTDLSTKSDKGSSGNVNDINKGDQITNEDSISNNNNDNSDNNIDKKGPPIKESSSENGNSKETVIITGKENNENKTSNMDEKCDNDNAENKKDKKRDNKDSEIKNETNENEIDNETNGNKIHNEADANKINKKVKDAKTKTKNNKKDDKNKEDETNKINNNDNKMTENDKEQKNSKTYLPEKDHNDKVESEAKTNKQTRNVKIADNSKWDRDLDRSKKENVTGDQNTEQNPKIINVKGDGEEDEEEESSGSEETGDSSKVTTPDPDEIERNIRKIGMKKSTEYQPQGELSKVLVSRKMEEKNRQKQDQGKWNKMKSLFRVKTKKIKDIHQNKENIKDTDIDIDGDEKKYSDKNVTPFMKEYNYKKQMQHQLEEQHVWGEKEDYTDRLKYSDDEDFEDIVDEHKKKIKEGKEGENEDKVLDEKKKKADEDRLGRQTKVEKMTDENNRTKSSVDKQQLKDDKKGKTKDKKEEEQAKDSGVDSPDFKKEKTDKHLTTEDEYTGQIEMTEPPPGFIKDSSGRIIRLYDNTVMTEEEMQSIFPLAKLGVLFHVPRLKRTSHGRPTGDYIEDGFGPKIKKDDGSIRNTESRDEHSKPKHPRSSKGSGRKEQRDQKTVAFEMDDGQSDILMIEDADNSKRRNSTDANRELLKKRLFRNKRKMRSRSAAESMYSYDEGRPRELSELVRVIPQTGQKHGTNNRAPIPGTVSRNDSLRKYDPEQQQMYREGLATDKKILERSPSMQRKPPDAPREAFVHHDPDDIRIQIENEENENRLQRSHGGVYIGSDDEFVLVGDQKPEPLFTTRQPSQATVRPFPGSHENFCPKHDMRHALPWSLINQYHIRESSLLDVNSVAKQHILPKSADAKQRSIDDRRLRELLEELYKDKKYFDHVIDTTEPSSDPIIDERDLAEHGREFLLERAEYWDERGQMLPRPPLTALGLRLSRMQTFVPDSGRVSNISYASTVTPPPPPDHIQQRSDVPQAFQRRENTIT